MVILAIGWLLMLAYAYPGVMTYDSVEQLREGRLGVFTDGHPPVMALLWGLVDHLCAGPFPMLAIQTSAFLGGLHLVLRRVLAPRTAAVVAVMLALYPPVLVPMAVIWKDALMAGMLVLGAGALLHQRRAAGLAALFVATAVRYNALAATLPLVILLLRWPKRPYLVAAAAWLGITVAAFGANRVLVDESKHYWYSTLALADIAGTLSRVDEDIPDAELRAQLAGTEVLVDHEIHAAMRERFNLDVYEPMINGPTALFHAPLYRGDTPMTEARRDAIGRAWHDIVTSHVGAYLRYRLAMFGHVLGIGPPNANLVVAHRGQDRARLATLDLEIVSARFQDHLERRFEHIARETPLFHPIVYLVIALLLLAMTRTRDVLALLLSGLALELSLLPAAPSTDYRYSHWLVVVTCLAAVLLFARRYGSSSSSPKITPVRSSTESKGSARIVAPDGNDLTSK